MSSDAATDPAPFSLFEGDWLNRVYAALGVGKYSRFALLKRCALVILLTWVPVAALAWWQGFGGGGRVATNFFADFAAYAQFLLGMPLFILAEPIIDSSTRRAGQQFVSCGVIRPEDRHRLSELHARIAGLRKCRGVDVVCIVLAYSLSLVILVPEFRAHAPITWHLHTYCLGGSCWRTLSLAGAWEFLVALPLLDYTWLRFGWKIFLWIYYLYGVSRTRLALHATHPDLVGGVGFISSTQSHFAIFILAYGISNIVSTVGYEITILGYGISTLTVWGPLVGFGIGAPLLFVLPLFMFTRQLYHCKQRALMIYRQRVTEHSQQVENRWLVQDRAPQSAADEIRDLTELSTLGTMFTRIQGMRVVPFDLTSFSQLVGSSFGSIATLLPLLHVSGRVTGVFDALGKILGHLGGH
ncbi:MAG TPA: hypothetical protein VGL55_08100 [Steroidobacteraceae bacterium]|jgi:hypothetical protein